MLFCYCIVLFALDRAFHHSEPIILSNSCHIAMKRPLLLLICLLLDYASIYGGFVMGH